MNKEQTIRALMKALGDFIIHDSLLSELLELIKGSGYESVFITMFLARLNTLATQGINAVRNKDFEILGGGINSMHIESGSFNIRVLYSFLPNGDPALLLAFYEREGKRRTNYSSYLEPAKNRLKSLRESADNEQYRV